MSRDITPQAVAGYATGGARLENPNAWSSPNWYAFELGRQLAANSRPHPTDVRMGRGDSIWASGVRWRFRHMAGGVRFEPITIAKSTGSTS